MRLLAILSIVLLPTGAAAQSRLSGDEAAILQDGLTATAEGFVQPAYAAQSGAADALVAALDGYCGGAGELAEVEAAFADLFLAWQRSALIQFGPVMQAEGPMRVQLWPDPKGFSDRAIRSAVNEADPALLAEGGLDGRSIALTNLTALEGLIYAPLPVEGYPCALAGAIATFQAGLAAELAEAWTEGSAFRRDLDTASGGNDRFASIDDPIRELLSGAVVQADRLRKFKLLRGLGDAPGDARPARSEAVESGLGLAGIEAGFRALAEFYTTPDGLFDAATEIGGTSEHVLLAQTAGSIADGLADETASLAEIAEEDGARAEELRSYAATLLYHEDFLRAGFTGAVGMTAGFTASDGD